MSHVSVGQCLEKGCRGKGSSMPSVCFNCSEFLSGTWDLYVIADGAPVTMTLKLKGMSGVVRREAVDRVPFEMSTLEPRVTQDAGMTIYSAGEFSTLDEPDFGVFALWLKGDPHVVSAVDDCIYRKGQMMPPPGLAFLPGCPATGVNPYVHTTTEGDGGGFVLTTVSHCCPQGMGGWLKSASGTKKVGAVALWLDL
jgi:hypothetical protein